MTAQDLDRALLGSGIREAMLIARRDSVLEVTAELLAFHERPVGHEELAVADPDAVASWSGVAGYQKLPLGACRLVRELRGIRITLPRSTRQPPHWVRGKSATGTSWLSSIGGRTATGGSTRFQGFTKSLRQDSLRLCRDFVFPATSARLQLRPLVGRRTPTARACSGCGRPGTSPPASWPDGGEHRSRSAGIPTCSRRRHHFVVDMSDDQVKGNIR